MPSSELPRKPMMPVQPLHKEEVSTMMLAHRPARERRQHRRFDYKGRVAVGRPARGSVLSGSIVNLSTGGCLMKLDHPADFTANTVVELSVRSPYLAFRALGSVRSHHDDDCLVGVEFMNIGTQGRQELRNVLRELDAAEHAHSLQEMN